MTDELQISLCAECHGPLIIEGGVARDPTTAEVRAMAKDDVLISALGTGAAFARSPWRCGRCAL